MVVVAFTFGGAALSAALHPAGGDFEAQAVGVVRSSGLRQSGSGSRTDWSGLADAIRSTRAAQVARRSGDVSISVEPLGRVAERPDQETSALLRLTARGLDSRYAESNVRRLSSGLAASLQSLRSGVVGRLGSAFNSPPTTVTSIDDGNAKVGNSSLRITCPAIVGCGPSRRLDRPFTQGVTYAVEGWARADNSSTELALVVGTTPDDFSLSEKKQLQPSWQRWTAYWTPKVTHDEAEVGFQTKQPRSTAFLADGFRVRRPIRTPADSGARLAVRKLRDIEFLTLGYTRATRASDRTVFWALVGACAGLAVALTLVGAGWAASRHSDRQAQD